MSDANANIKLHNAKFKDKIDPLMATPMDFGTFIPEHEDFEFADKEDPEARLANFTGV